MNIIARLSRFGPLFTLRSCLITVKSFTLNIILIILNVCFLLLTFDFYRALAFYTISRLTLSLEDSTHFTFTVSILPLLCFLSGHFYLPVHTEFHFIYTYLLWPWVLLLTILTSNIYACLLFPRVLLLTFLTSNLFFTYFPTTVWLTHSYLLLCFSVISLLKIRFNSVCILYIIRTHNHPTLTDMSFFPQPWRNLALT